MTRTLRLIALALIVPWTTAPVLAEPAEGPPAWNDAASVYLTMSHAAAEKAAPSQTAVVNSQVEPGATPAASTTASANVEASPIVETAVVPAAQDSAAESASSESDSRYLAPPSTRMASAGKDASRGPIQPAGAASRRLAEFGVPTQSISTTLTALTIVIGAFLLFMWALKRGGRRKAGRNALPSDVVSVLGRVPLAARQFAELLRVGNKLVLISLTPTGAETLTEVTDPAEVDRLVGLCQQGNPFSTTRAFEQVFQQMSSETTPSGFLGGEAFMTTPATPVAAYRSNRRGTARG
jgi:flagellar biogenesis protein FliO